MIEFPTKERRAVDSKGWSKSGGTIGLMPEDSVGSHISECVRLAAGAGVSEGLVFKLKWFTQAPEDENYNQFQPPLLFNLDITWEIVTSH